jgi:hypothetical protein
MLNIYTISGIKIFFDKKTKELPLYSDNSWFAKILRETEGIWVIVLSW